MAAALSRLRTAKSAALSLRRFPASVGESATWPSDHEGCIEPTLFSRFQSASSTCGQQFKSSAALSCPLATASCKGDDPLRALARDPDSRTLLAKSMPPSHRHSSSRAQARSGSPTRAASQTASMRPSESQSTSSHGACIDVRLTASLGSTSLAMSFSRAAQACGVQLAEMRPPEDVVTPTRSASPRRCNACMLLRMSIISAKMASRASELKIIRGLVPTLSSLRTPSPSWMPSSARPERPRVFTSSASMLRAAAVAKACNVVGCKPSGSSCQRCKTWSTAPATCPQASTASSPARCIACVASCHAVHVSSIWLCQKSCRCSRAARNFCSPALPSDTCRISRAPSRISS
mmetsp:Transcript_89753/g.172791  ORF Transcript_89753/g.172791 Transcript_89753/m.172791 type:complete len:349 (-) Transcript_89753:507-1553(-)